MKKTPIIALLMAILMMASAAIAEQADNPVVVKVGDVEILLDEAQATFDQEYAAQVNYFASYGEEFPAEELPYLLSDVVENMRVRLVLDAKIEELGLGEVTEEEKAAVREEATLAFESDLQNYAAYMNMDVEQARQAVAEAEGITADVYYEYSLLDLPYLRLYEYITEDIEVTDEEVQAQYDAYVERDRGNYENDIANYELMTSDMYAAYFGTQDAYYTPEGYRLIKHILLDIPESLQTEMADLEADLNMGNTILRSLESELNDLENVPEEAEGETEEPATTPARGAEIVEADIKAQQETIDFLMGQYNDLKAQFVPMLSDVIDEITSRLEAGESFETLVDEFNMDAGMANYPDGYKVHKDSVNWVPEFSQAAMALEKVGDISEPVATDYGVHILLYAGDVEGGVLPLTDELKAKLHDEMLTEREQTAYMEAFTQWEAELGTEAHPELVQLPEMITAEEGDALVLEEGHTADDGHDHGAELEIEALVIDDVEDEELVEAAE